MSGYRVITSLAVGLLFCLLAFGTAGGQGKQAREVPWDVLDGGGGLMCSPSFSMGGSLGEIAPGISGSVSRKVWAGYWAGVDELPPCEERLFIRADANSDTTVTMSDAIFTLRYLYVPGEPEPTCMKTADSDDSGEVAMSDALYTLRYLYVPGEPSPPAPFPNCGSDPTTDELTCDGHPCMAAGVAAAREVESIRRAPVRGSGTKREGRHETR